MTGLEPLVLAQIAGVAVSAVGSLASASSASNAANFNAQVAQRNALISRQNAQAQADKEGRLARLRAGTARATAGAAGGGIAGSALDLLEDNALEEALNVATIRQQGELEAQGFEGTATLERMKGKSAKTQGFVRAGSQLLLGTSRALST